MRAALLALALSGYVPLLAAPTQLSLTGPAELFRRDHVSTPLTEIRLTFSPDGSRMLWGVIGRHNGPGGWEILESIRTDGQWSAPALVSFNTAANEFDPSFAPDGSGVYFFSNRPGGLGGDDLYFVPFDRATGRYGTPRNLGPDVNSAGDEWAPCVSPDNQRLLFATNGRGGAGRHDLFVAQRADDGQWHSPAPLSALNTPDDDFDATFLHDGHSIVFSSGRVDGTVRLYAAIWDGSRHNSPSLLGPEINSPLPDAFTNGPSISATEPGWLYFSTHRPDGAGRMDIYRVRYELTTSHAR